MNSAGVIEIDWYVDLSYRPFFICLFIWLVRGWRNFLACLQFDNLFFRYYHMVALIDIHIVMSLSQEEATCKFV